MLDVFEAKSCYRFYYRCGHHRRKRNKCNFSSVFKTLTKSPKENRYLCQQSLQALQRRYLISGFHYRNPWNWFVLFTLFLTELHDLGKTVTKSIYYFVYLFLSVYFERAFLDINFLIKSHSNILQIYKHIIHTNIIHTAFLYF